MCGSKRGNGTRLARRLLAQTGSKGFGREARPVERDDSGLRPLVARDSRRWTRRVSVRDALRSLITSPGRPPALRPQCGDCPRSLVACVFCLPFFLLSSGPATDTLFSTMFKQQPCIVNRIRRLRFAERENRVASLPLARRAGRLSHKRSFSTRRRKRGMRTQPETNAQA